MFCLFIYAGALVTFIKFKNYYLGKCMLGLYQFAGSQSFNNNNVVTLCSIADVCYYCNISIMGWNWEENRTVLLYCICVFYETIMVTFDSIIIKKLLNCHNTFLKVYFTYSPRKNWIEVEINFLRIFKMCFQWKLNLENL